MPSSCHISEHHKLHRILPGHAKEWLNLYNSHTYSTINANKKNKLKEMAIIAKKSHKCPIKMKVIFEQVKFIKV